MKSDTLKGVVPALTTPFDEGGALDENGLAQLIEHVIDDGVDGILMNGCTGESWALSAEERARVFQISVETARGRVPVVAGCSGISARETSAKIEQAQKAGCDVVMVSPPWYIMPGPEEILDHYHAVLDQCELPVMLYNIPRRTGVMLTPEIVDRLADHPKVVSIKESSKDWGILSETIRRTSDRIDVFVGYASYFGLAALTEGAVGYVDSSTPVFGARSPAFYRAAINGDLETARRLQGEMAKMLQSFFGLGTFPAAVKAALDLQGRPGGPTRPPIRPLTQEQRETLGKAMQASGLLDAANTSGSGAR